MCIRDRSASFTCVLNCSIYLLSIIKPLKHKVFWTLYTLLLLRRHFLADKYGAVIDFIDVPKLPYSSTDIRKKVAMGLSVKEDVGEEVEELSLIHILCDYIQQLMLKTGSVSA